MTRRSMPAVVEDDVEPLAAVEEDVDEDADDETDVPEIEADEDTEVDPAIVRD